MSKPDGGPAFPCIVENEIGLNDSAIIIPVTSQEESEKVQNHVISIGVDWIIGDGTPKHLELNCIFLREENMFGGNDANPNSDQIVMQIDEFLKLSYNDFREIFKKLNYKWVMSKNGMSLRDYFAAKAMQYVIIGIVNKESNTQDDVRDDFKYASIIAYEIADAMLAAREK